jgi:hypothetical protein
MGFKQFKDIRTSDDEGKITNSFFRKTVGIGTLAQVWYDFSMAPGNPIPNYYASTPLVSATLASREGIYYGGNVPSNSSRHLLELSLSCSQASTIPMQCLLLDYLLYYPFIDQGTTDYQPMINSIPLSRYSDGIGVKIMTVIIAPPVTGGSQFRVYYKNTNGEDKVTPIHTCGLATYNGALANTGATATNLQQPFLTLDTDDIGVTQINGVEFLTNDVGLIALVLVKPITSIYVRELNTFMEKNMVINSLSLPRIENNAYLGVIGVTSNASLVNLALTGEIKTIWR